MSREMGANYDMRTNGRRAPLSDERWVRLRILA